MFCTGDYSSNQFPLLHSKSNHLLHICRKLPSNPKIRRNVSFCVIQNQVELNHKIERRFGVVMTPFSSSKIINDKSKLSETVR